MRRRCRRGIQDDDAHTGQPFRNRLVGNPFGGDVVHHRGHHQPGAQFLGAVARLGFDGRARVAREFTGLADGEQVEDAVVELG